MWIISANNSGNFEVSNDDTPNETYTYPTREQAEQCVRILNSIESARSHAEYTSEKWG